MEVELGRSAHQFLDKGSANFLCARHDHAGERTLLKRLFPLARIVTPNLAEAQALSGVDGTSPAAIRAMANMLGKAGARAVLIKGGHPGSSPEARAHSVDLFYNGGEFIELRASRIPGGGAHGLRRTPQRRARGG